jgi:L-ascorbate peroxidase
LDRPESKGLKRGWRVVEDLRDTILKQSSLAISYADLVVICGAWAVEVCGGPKIAVQVGREDSDTADAENMIPNENIPIKDLKAAFKRMNLNTRELVTLSGSHALGGKGFGEPLQFDNVYYKTLLEKPWESSDSMKQMIGIPSDRVLPDDAECRRVIEDFADSEDTFFESFVSSYNKLTTSGYLAGSA